MKLFQPLAVLSLSACLLSGCQQAPLRRATYVLRPQQSVQLAQDVGITYDSFSDSRCPANAQCVWAGRLVFRFVLDGPDGTEEFSLGPDHTVETPAALKGGRIVLDPAAIPAARPGGNTRPAEILPVTLTILPK